MINENNNQILRPDESIIKPARVIPCAIKRLATKDGLGTAAGHVRIGDEFLLDLDSIEYLELTNPNGLRHKQLTIYVVDVNGKRLGWMYSELFFT